MHSRPGPDLQPPPEVAVPGAERSLWRDWRSVLLAPAGDGRRRRRGTDGMRLAAAILALACCLLIIHYDSRIDRAIVAVIHPPPWSITWLVTVVYQAGSFGVVIVLVALALLARRWEIARDIGLSAVGAAAVTGLLVLWLGSHGGRPSGVVIGDYDLSFPVLRIAFFAAVATAALPYLARGLQVTIEIFIALVALASAVGGHGLPLNVVGSLVIGWGTTAVVRLVFGSPLGLPSADDVRRLLADFGLTVGQLQPIPEQAWGAAKYEATEYDGHRDCPRRFLPPPRHRRLRPGCRRRAAADQGGPVPAVPGFRPGPHADPAPAGPARGVLHPAGRSGGRGRAGAGRGGNRGAVEGRGAGVPSAERDLSIRGRPGRRQRWRAG